MTDGWRLRILDNFWAIHLCFTKSLVYLKVMMRIVLALLLTVLLATHVAKPSFAWVDDTSVEIADVGVTAQPGDADRSDDSTDPALKHTSPCQDHCAGSLVGAAAESVPSHDRGKIVVGPVRFASACLAVSVPPPQST